jgi:hypothetical protein
VGGTHRLLDADDNEVILSSPLDCIISREVRWAGDVEGGVGIQLLARLE